MRCVAEYTGADSNQQPDPTVADSAHIGGNMHSVPGYPTYLRVALVALAAMQAAGCSEASAPAPRETGAIEITVTTTTNAEGITDPDGYSLSFDNLAPHLIAVDAAMTMSDVVLGRHLLRLEGLASGCYVDGDNPLSVAVRSSTSNTPVHMSVICGGLSPWDY
jgi:hypothetical protein